MSREDDYRRSAASCFDLASKAGSLGERTRLLVMAEGWLDLINRVSRLATRQISGTDHPQVRAALGARNEQAPPERADWADAKAADTKLHRPPGRAPRSVAGGRMR